MKKVYRLTSVILLVALLSVFMCVPALAADLSGDADVYQYWATDLDSLISRSGSSSARSLTYPLYDDSLSISHNYASSRYMGWGALDIPLTNISSNIIVAFSYYFTANNSTSDTVSFGSAGDKAVITSWVDPNGVEQSSSDDGIYKTFTPSVGSTKFSSIGVSLRANFSASELDSISNLRVEWGPETVYAIVGSGDKISRVIPSFRVISSDATSVEIEGLEEIADAIAAQNDILQAMKSLSISLTICTLRYGGAKI